MTKESFIKEVKNLCTSKEWPDTNSRLDKVNSLIESYIISNNDTPSDTSLKALADYLLVDILSDQYKHYRKDEYPIQSKKQIIKRNIRHQYSGIHEEAVGF